VPDSTLSQALKEAYASAPSDLVIYHTLELRHPSFTSPIRVVRDYADLVATLEVSTLHYWQFSNSLEGFTLLNYTSTLLPTSVELTATTTGPQFVSPIFPDMNGADWKYVQARIRRVSGSAGWEGSLYYDNTTHGWDAGYYHVTAHPNPGAMGEWTVVQWDMSNQSVGAGDWLASQHIRKLRLDFVQASGDVWEVDWVRVSSTPLDPVTFVRFAFDFTKPEVSAAGVPQLTIELDNVDRSIVANIEAALASTEMVQATYREYVSTDLTCPANDPPIHMTIMSITADVFRVKAVAGFPDLMNRRFPSTEYNSEVFPGLLA